MTFFFLTMSHSFYIANSSTSFESLFYTKLKVLHEIKQLKANYSKTLQRRKLKTQFCLPLGWLHICVSKL